MLNFHKYYKSLRIISRENNRKNRFCNSLNTIIKIGILNFALLENFCLAKLLKYFEWNWDVSVGKVRQCPHSLMCITTIERTSRISLFN